MSVAHEGMEMARAEDFSATLTQEDFAKNLKPLLTSPEMRAGRKEQLPLDETCGFPGRRVSGPDTCARLAEIASRINSLSGGDAEKGDGATEWIAISPVVDP